MEKDDEIIVNEVTTNLENDKIEENDNNSNDKNNYNLLITKPTATTMVRVLY